MVVKISIQAAHEQLNPSDLLHAMMDHGMKQENLTSEFNQRLRGLIMTTE